MPRREQTGSGGARSSRASGASGAGRTRKPRKAAHPRAKRRAEPKAKVKQTAGAAAPAAQHPAGGSAWRGVAGSISPGPLRTLASDHTLPGVALELVGAQQTTLNESLGATLGAWGAARDLATNRAWRRPGGLRRMAGL